MRSPQGRGASRVAARCACLQNVLCVGRGGGSKSDDVQAAFDNCIEGGSERLDGDDANVLSDWA